MSLNFLLLLAVHENVHVLPMKLNFSDPKIYTGGVAISKWSKLTSKEKNEALEKPWYVYFSFRHPKTGKLEKQFFIKARANKLKQHKSACFFRVKML